MPSPTALSAGSLGATVLMGAIVFMLTNADGFLLLTFFFGHRSRQPWRIVVGEAAGFSAIVGCGLLGRLAAVFVSPRHLGWLGLVPIALGLHQWWGARAQRDRALVATDWSVMRVAAVVFASGADNIAVYLPLFAASSNRQLLAILGTFAVLVAAICALAAYLGSHELLRASVHRLGPRLPGTVLIALGAYILWSSGVLAASPPPPIP